MTRIWKKTLGISVGMLGLWTLAGCDVEEPTPPEWAGDEQASQERTVYKVGDIISSHGLSEGDEIVLEIAEMKSVDMYAQNGSSNYTYQVKGGDLVAIDGGPELPSSDEVVNPLGIADAQPSGSPAEFCLLGLPIGSCSVPVLV